MARSSQKFPGIDFEVTGTGVYNSFVKLGKNPEIFDYVDIRDLPDLAEDNRSIVIWKSYLENEKDVTLLFLVWDRIDEALYMKVSKQPVDGQRYDLMNTAETLDHRIYPQLVDGAPTVAGQLNALKSGFSKAELPSGASMNAEVINLEEILVTFAEQFFVNTIETREVSAISLPKGYILGLTLSNAGSGYLDGSVVGLYGGSGRAGYCQITATETIVTGLTIDYPGQWYVDGAAYPSNRNLDSSGSGLYIRYSVDRETGAINSVEILEPGSGYVLGDTVTLPGVDPAILSISSVTGGQVTSVKIPEYGGVVTTTKDDYGRAIEQSTSVTANMVSGGVGYQAGTTYELLSSNGVQMDDNAQVQITSVVANQTYDPSIEDIVRFEDAFFGTYTGTWSAQVQYPGTIVSGSKKGTTFSATGLDLQYDTTYKVIVTDVLNLAKQTCTVEDFVQTATATQPCSAMTGILFEAYGNGPVTLGTASYTTGAHASNKFMYFGVAGLSWSGFTGLAEFTGANPPISVPTGITAPTTVYAYYRSGTYLLPDSSWIVGIIGSETDYEGNYEYVLYTLDNILNYKQLTTAGSSTDACGTSGWGGDWGASIQQFRINR